MPQVQKRAMEHRAGAAAQAALRCRPGARAAHHDGHSAESSMSETTVTTDTTRDRRACRRRPLHSALLVIATAAASLAVVRASGAPTPPATTTAAPDTTATAPYSPARAAVYFSPDGGAQAAIVREVDAAQLWIRVQAYGFTSAPVLDALKRAHNRGVQVRLVLDRSNRTARYSGATFMQNAGVPVLIDARHAIAHNRNFDAHAAHSEPYREPYRREVEATQKDGVNP